MRIARYWDAAANAAKYDENASRFLSQLEQLDAELRQRFAAVPVERRKLVANHDAFGYFVDAYGITFVGSVIPSGDTTSEPKPGDTDKLLKALKDQHVCAIFTESSIRRVLDLTETKRFSSGIVIMEFRPAKTP